MQQLTNEVLIYGLVTNTVLVLAGMFLAAVAVYAVRQIGKHYGKDDGYFVVAVAAGVIAIGLIGIQGAELFKVVFLPNMYLFEQTKGLVP